MTAMMLWISQHTGYTIPELPTIVELSPFDLKRFAYGCDETPIPNGNDDICSVQEYWDLDEWGKENTPLALYDHYEQRIILRKGFDIDTIHDQSVLFHELVHHVQFNNGIYDTVECKGELEKLAYSLQDKWLQEKYNVSVYEVIDINELFLMIITACHDSMWGIPDPAYQNQNQKFDSAQ